MKKVFVAALSAFALLAGSANAADVNIGYQLVYGPWKANKDMLEKEGLGGKVQMVFIDPPYGVRCRSIARARSEELWHCVVEGGLP